MICKKCNTRTKALTCFYCGDEEEPCKEGYGCKRIRGDEK